MVMLRFMLIRDGCGKKSFERFRMYVTHLTHLATGFAATAVEAAVKPATIQMRRGRRQ